MKLLSLVIPVFNEEESLPEFYQRLTEIRNKLKPLEINAIFVNDGSRDDSLKRLKEIAERDSSVSVVSLSRNFGSHAAIRAGLNYVKTDAAVILSADLQDPLEIIEKLVSAWEKGSDVVWAAREARKGPFFPELAARIFYLLMKTFAIHNYPEKGVDFCLIDKKVCRFISSSKEKNTNVFGLILWSGFKQSFIIYHRGKRKKGVSKWTFGKKLKLLIDSFVSFSSFPLRLATYLGFIFSGISLFYIMSLLVNDFKGAPVSGWTSLAVLISSCFALQFFMLGIFGEYLWRTFDETRKRPLYLIDETIDKASRCEMKAS